MPSVPSAGDLYDGPLVQSKPNGYGVYTWADGSRYEGDWQDGVKHGRGTYTWPSGSTYEGDWAGGRMHGQGTYCSKDGTRYQGSWVDDLKHGLGTKRFPNGDEYQGLWRNGLPYGPGMYKWANGNEYNGEWVAGSMSGRGTFRWASGERYDGQWLDGREEGRGTFTWPDGSYFDGNWAAGEKHGMGMWAPPLAGPADGAAPDAPREALLREYDRGALVREERVPAQQRPVGDPVAGRPAVKTRKVRQVRMGETIFKGAPSYDLMLQLQLGIRWSVGRITPEKPREIGDIDFRLNSPLAAVSARFPRGGSSTTPPHASHDFKWKDYCPMVRTHRLRAVSFSQQLLSLNCTQVFRKLRERFGIDAGEYMLSLCGDKALRELSSPGKSGSVFFLSQDGRFIVKTMRKAEMTHLSRVVLRDYYAHVLQYPDTLLTRFFGLHRVKPHGGRNVRFVVMGNLLCTGHKIHRRYDLKGSTYGRITEAPYDAGKKILKDLDIEYTFQLDDGYAARLTAQLDADCRLLQRLNIMDYSLLLGVHFQTSGTNGSAAATEAGRQGRPSRERSLSAVLASRAPGKPKEGEEEDDDDDDDFDGDTNTHLGENMTALAIPGRVLKAPKGVEQLPLPTERASVILNFGVIDILQEYNMSKQIEHSWKSVVQRQQNISSVDPTEYAERFKQFMSALFS